MLIWIRDKYDDFLYWLAYEPMKRIVKRTPGTAYLFELWIRDYNRANPISDRLKQVTETFYNSLKEERG